MASLNKYILIALGVLFASNMLLTCQNNKLKKDIKRVSQNYETQMTGISRELDLTKKEINKLYPKIDSLTTQVVGLKMQSVEKIISFEYNFKDTTITNTYTVIDSLHPGRENFKIPRMCGSISGYIQINPGKKTEIAITNEERKDSIDIWLYDQKPQWIKIGKVINWKKFWVKPTKTGIGYSECYKQKFPLGKIINVKK